LKTREVVLISFLGLALTVLTFLPSVARLIGWASPEWILMFVIYLTFRAGLTSASLAAFVLGCFQDALTLSPEGLESMALLLTVIIVSFCQEYMKLNNSLLVLLTALTALFKNALFIPSFMGLMGLHQRVSLSIVFDCLLKAFVTGLAAVPVILALDRLLGTAEK
jgi:rod shape-determining protein MreD